MHAAVDQVLADGHRSLGVPVAIATVALLAMVLAFFQVLWVWSGRPKVQIGRRRKTDPNRRATSAADQPRARGRKPGGKHRR
jgi:hypothetical protein